MSAGMVYVVDDDPAVREGLSSLARSLGHDIRAFASADEFLAHERPGTPACLVLDVHMPGLSGLELQERLASAGAGLPIIFITGHGDIPMSVKAMKAGAFEFLPKPFDDATLVAAIEAALERSRTALVQREALDELRRSAARLTPREREVALCVVQGMLNKQVAARLGITEITVKVHRRHIMEKLRLKSVADLVRFAAQVDLSI